MRHDEAPSTNPDSIALGYEASRVSVRGLFWFFVGFVSFGLLMHLLLWWVLGVLVRASAPDTPPRSPFAAQIAPTPAAPLQPSPSHPTLAWQDFRSMRQHEDRELSRYARTAGDHASIPIERAMELALQHGILTTRPANDTQPFVRRETQR